MDDQFKNKVVWITGASAGIGEALALAFAAKEAILVLSARNKAALEAIAVKCTNAGAVKVMVQPLDLADTTAINTIAAVVIEQVGSIDVLINNAGVSQRAFAKDSSMNLYRLLMEINFFGTVAVTKAVLPFMLANQSGQIITISSLAGKIGTPLRSGYAASKHALHGFFDSLRAELQDDHIKVLLVCPGFIKTNISVNALNAAGNKTGTMDNNQQAGMLPSVLADKVIAAMISGKQEIYVGGKETLILYIKRFFPNLVNGIVRKRH